MNATIVPPPANSLEIKRQVIDDSGRSWLYVDLPEGWDTCKKLTKLRLEFAGKVHVWRSWNSDRNEAMFLESEEPFKNFARKL